MERCVPTSRPGLCFLELTLWLGREELRERWGGHVAEKKRTVCHESEQKDVEPKPALLSSLEALVNVLADSALGGTASDQSALASSPPR